MVPGDGGLALCHPHSRHNPSQNKGIEKFAFIFLLKYFQVDPNNEETLHTKLPPSVRWKANNYNHLMEQPTIFYATALALASAGEGHGLNVTLAWLYVILRVLHSLVQAKFNHIMARFSLFIVSSFVVLALAVRAALIIF